MGHAVRDRYVNSYCIGRGGAHTSHYSKDAHGLLMIDMMRYTNQCMPTLLENPTQIVKNWRSIKSCGQSPRFLESPVLLSKRRA